MSDQHTILKSAWNEFQRVYIPANTSDQARLMVRSTFYAGMSAIISALQLMADLPEDEVMARLTAMTDEMNAFANAEVERLLGERG